MVKVQDAAANNEGDLVRRRAAIKAGDLASGRRELWGVWLTTERRNSPQLADPDHD